MRILGLDPTQRDVFRANRRSAYERYAVMHSVCDSFGIPGARLFLNAAMCDISVVIMAETPLNPQGQRRRSQSIILLVLLYIQ